MVDGVSCNEVFQYHLRLLPGITLNLKKAEVGTTVTLDVNRDLEGLTGLIKGFVDQYNQVMDFIRTQSTYNQTDKQTGGFCSATGPCGP